MAFDLEKMTVSYRSLLKLVPTQRTQLAQSGIMNDLIAALTPGQLVNLFPRYYRDQLPDVGQVNNYSQRLDVALSGGSRYTSSSAGGVTYSTSIPKPPSKMAQELAVEAILKENNIVPQENISRVTGSTAQILATIRTRESRNNYSIESTSSTASGAYQFIDKTWQMLTARYGIGQEYSRAASAPPEIQDKVAAKYIEQILAENNGDISKVPLVWYTGNPQGKISADAIAKNNGLTPEMYQSDWLKEFNNHADLASTEMSESNKKRLEAIESELMGLSDDIRKKLDNKTLELYDKASSEQKWNIEKAISSVGVDEFNKRVDLIAKTEKNITDTAQSLVLEGGSKFVSEKDPRQFYEGNKAVKIDDEIWNHVHPDLARDRDRIYAGGQEIRTGAILAADASFRYAASKGIPMRVAVEGGVDPHSTNHLKDGVGEALDIKPGTRDDRGRDVETSNTWEKFGLNPVDIATVSAATIQSLGGTARIGVAGPDSSSGVHTQDTGNEGLGIHERYGGMSWAYGSDPYGAEGGDFKTKLQSGYFGENYKDLIDSLYNPEESEASSNTATATATQNQVQPPQQNQPETAVPANTETPVVVDPNKLPKPPVLANGGNIEVPTGEDIVGVNTKTGETEFFANSRENIRVEPGTLENPQQMPVVTQEDIKSLETPTQTVNPKQQPVYRENPDPNLYDTASGSYYVPPSQMRATNRAKLHGDDSSAMINGHFA